MAQQVFPTKSNLMATKRSLALAAQGYDLMDRKRNILVREMMQLIDRAAGIQDRISAAYAEAYEALKKANIMLGSVGGYAAGVPVERGVQLSTRSVMGVELPTLKLNTTSPLGLYYDLESTNGTLDVAYLKFNVSVIYPMPYTNNMIYPYSIHKSCDGFNPQRRFYECGTM